MRAVLVIDAWDEHWHEPTNKLMDGGLAKQMNRFIKRMRPVIIHAPANCKYPKSNVNVMPQFTQIETPPPLMDNKIDDPETRAWTKQHPDIEIYPEDYILVKAPEIFSLLKQKGIKTVYLIGLHMAACIVNRPYGAQNLLRYGFEPIIVEDLTEPMHLDKKEVIEKIHSAGIKTMLSKDIRRSE